jgi:hypothetical protein
MPTQMDPIDQASLFYIHIKDDGQSPKDKRFSHIEMFMMFLETVVFIGSHPSQETIPENMIDVF